MAHPFPPLVVSASLSALPDQLSKVSPWLAAQVPPASVFAPDMTAQDVNTGEERTGLDPNSPIFRRLVTGILYSRWLALTYYGVFAGILLVFVAANWIPTLKSWIKSRNVPGTWFHSINGTKPEDLRCKERLQRRHNECDSSPSSSGSLTPVSVPQNLDEHTPLLQHNGKTDSSPPALQRLWRYTKSYLTYQPGSVPGFRNRMMPSNATTVLMIMFLGINLFYLLFNIEFSIPMMFILADRAAVLLITNLPILYVVGAKNQPLQPLIGYSYASLNIVHRRLGEWMCLLAFFHASLMVTVWATLLRPGGYTFVRFISDRVAILGFCTLLCYAAIFLTSTATIRQMAYEVFLASHVLLQAGALGFLYFHHSQSRFYVLLSVAIWAVDRVLYRLIAKTRTFKAAINVRPDKETIGVSISIPLAKPSWLQSLFGLKSVAQGWKTLDHIFLGIPALSPKYTLQSHPFSIASSAPSPDDRSADMDLIIRARNGFSKDLLKCAMNEDTVAVRIDGPYGAHSVRRMLRDSDSRVVIAGGSGIAVTRPLLEHLLTENDMQAGDIEQASGSVVTKPILFVWIVHSKKQLNWVDMEELQTLGARPGLDIVIPRPTNEAGRPNLSRIISHWVESKGRISKTGVVVSGPDGMSREVRNDCALWQRRGFNVQIEVEKYGW